jgi:Outer membrane protein and related peptidoglycan-associated (lipo)proteins
MSPTRFTILALLILPSAAIPLRAQSPTDTTVSDTAKKQSRFGGLMNRAKQVAGNKTVQNAAKNAATNVACTAVPGAAVAAATGKGPCQNTVMAGLMAKSGIAGAAANLANGTSSSLAAKAMGKMSGGTAAAAVGALGVNGNGTVSKMAAAANAGQLGQAAALSAAAQMIPGSVPTTASGVAGAVGGLKGLFGKKGGAGKPPTASAPPTTAGAGAPASPWLNYDFVPGPNTIFYSDFSDDKVGNFPSRLQFAEGNMEVAELGGQRVLRATGQSRLSIPLPIALPEKFTIEMDVINRPSIDGADFHLRGNVGRVDDAKTSIISWGSDGVSLAGGGGGEVRLISGDAMRQRYRGKPAQLRILGDGNYIKVFLDEKRMANVPNANFERSNTLTLFIDARGDDNPAYISRIRVAESRVSLYDDMMAGSGRVATQGLLFNSGSAVLNPESAPTLREIASMMVLHPELRLRIEGYTDNVGAKDANLALSTQRAAAVKVALVNGFQIPPNRLDSKGMGDSKPIRKDNSAEARQTNRRVELVKM